MMKLLSVNVGLPREVVWQGETVLTGIFKEPVAGPLMLRGLNLEGDAQADLSAHGGVKKAVYVYPFKHYEYWKAELPGADLPRGMFGENLTTEGLLEGEVNIGDQFRIGGAEVLVTQPRMPCYKLGIKFGRADMVKKFLASRRTGFYLSVLRGGLVEAGDEIERISRDEHGVSVADVVRVYAFDHEDLETLRRAAEVEALPEGWRNRFRRQIEAASEGTSQSGGS